MRPKGAPKVALTGATGFVGSAILAELLARGADVSVLTRRPFAASAEVRQRIIGDLATLDASAARAALSGIDTLIHAAGHAHAEGDAALHARINRDAGIRLAEAAAVAGTRMVFLSSIRAQAGATSPVILREDDPPLPEDAYGRAKLAAEEGIRTALPGRHVIIRPVLVCGVGAKGNLATLLRLAALPLPLPFGALDGRRSLIAVDDLATLAASAFDMPALIGRTIIAADPDPLTPADMITAMRAGMGRGPGLFSVPPVLLKGALRLTGRGKLAGRLLSPLVAEPAALLERGWSPRESLREVLARMGQQQAAFAARNH